MGYWKTLWEEHARFASAQHPQCQVMRTLNKKPVTGTALVMLLRDVEKKMAIRPGDEILDLCCGNGWITTHLASKCKHVTGVDFAQGLIDQIHADRYGNISTVTADIREVDFEEGSFDRAIIYASIQYLSHREACSLIESVARWLRDGGFFFIGDVPDRGRMWNFFDTPERRRVYFDSVKNEEPILGTWFDPQWLVAAAEHCGFEAEIRLQPDQLPNSHYRFDLKATRCS